MAGFAKLVVKSPKWNAQHGLRGAKGGQQGDASHYRRGCSAWLERLTSAPVGVGDLTLGRDTLVLV